MMTNHSGFTMIELMIVVAILGILSLVALPLYQDYSEKSQVMAALGEIAPGKKTAEVLLNDGMQADVTDASAIGLATSVRCPSLDVSVATNGAVSITCTLAGGPAITGKTITLTRSTSGAWSCSSQVLAKHAPKGCTGV